MKKITLMQRKKLRIFDPKLKKKSHYYLYLTGDQKKINN